MNEEKIEPKIVKKVKAKRKPGDLNKSMTVTMSMTPRFRKKIDDAAIKLGITRSILIRKAVVDLLKTQPCKADFKREF